MESMSRMQNDKTYLEQSLFHKMEDLMCSLLLFRDGLPRDKVQMGHTDSPFEYIHKWLIPLESGT
jgi:hypothetical protein